MCMNKIKLDDRLKIAAEYVRHGSVAVDIGTDHAYLPVYLVQNGICERTIACDVNELPLESAKKTIELYELSDKIEVRLSNGLCEIDSNECDDIVICGMGGELIANILENCEWIKNDKYNLILNPMTKADKLREYLAKNGFTIKSENAAESHKKHYTIMNVVYSGEITVPDLKYIYFGKLLDNKSDACKQLIEMTVNQLRKKTRGMDEKTAFEIEQLILEILEEI